MATIKISDEAYVKLVQKAKELDWDLEDMATTIIEDNVDDYK